MTRLPFLLTIGSVGTAAVLAIGTSIYLAGAMERRSIEAVQLSLEREGIDWVEVSANGLQLELGGIAPSEAAAFRAFSRAGTIIDGNRIVNTMQIAEQAMIGPPRFSVDMLRNDDGVQIIGLVPLASGDAAVTALIDTIGANVDVTNMVETANFPVPDTWDAALEYGLRALAELPRAKISVYEDRVEVQAVSESTEERAEFLAALQRGQPRDVEVALDISAPRPVITPFTVRFTIDDEGARFETCAADTIAARDRILSAARAAGAEGVLVCDIGLGVPSAQWADAVGTAITALADLGMGTVAFSDADVTFIAQQGTGQDEFDRVAGELEVALPDLFSLSAMLPEPEVAANGLDARRARFIATLGEDATVRLRGRLPDGPVGGSVEAYARALFGLDETDIATRSVSDLPQGWSVRAIAGLEALSTLHDGTLVIEPDRLVLSGNTGNPNAISDITRLLSDDLGAAAEFELDVSYIEALDPIASQPTPEECVSRIQAIQADDKIIFEPGSVQITERAGEILDRIAEVLPECQHVSMEIGGHTDSQGREEMNLNLSQSRADAVLNGLLARNVLVSNLVARGYGETRPIDQNETDAGRERNRRIEFALVGAIRSELIDDALVEGIDAPASDAQSERLAAFRPVRRPVRVVVDNE